jgi:hypothetical protein
MPPDDTPATRIELANGSVVPLHEAVACFTFLEVTLRNRRIEFDTLLAVTRGVSIDDLPSPNTYRRLQKLQLISDQGSVAPVYRALLESAVIESPTGEVELVPPVSRSAIETYRLWVNAEVDHTKKLVAKIFQRDTVGPEGNSKER